MLMSAVCNVVSVSVAVSVAVLFLKSCFKVAVSKFAGGFGVVDRVGADLGTYHGINRGGLRPP